MAAPVGITREQVVDAAVGVLEEKGRTDGIALREVAQRLGVRTQSLYAHVDGADGLRHALALRAHAALADHLRKAPATLDGIVRAYYAFAVDHPGLYDASLRPPGDDPEMVQATTEVTKPLNDVLATYGLDEAARVHWYRIIFAGVHGMAVLQRDGLLTFPGNPEDSLGRMITAYERALSTTGIGE